MKITMHGAAGEVTGSAYLVESENATLLVDCGMFQGGKKQRARNRLSAQARLDNIDAVLLTHAHLDHVGRLPLLIKRGFNGPIYATPATMELAEIILLDSARIQEYDTARENRKRQRAGRKLVEPLYTTEDAEQTLALMREAPYERQFEVADGITAKLIEAGHMLGSVSIQLRVEEKGRKKIIVFSGDIGRKDMVILRDAEMFRLADLVIMESTYGSRNHRSADQTADELWDLVRWGYEQGSKMLVPAFSIGRTQEIIYCVAGAFQGGEVPAFPVFLDSPMAIRATRVYLDHPELMDEEATALLETGKLVPDMSYVVPTETAAESKALNDLKGPMMIIAGSGMMTGGRILHHLRHNLWRPETILFVVGYQAQGTLGRKLVDGADRVRIYGEWVAVEAQICTIGGFSGHAGQSTLLEWLSTEASHKPRVALTHGEDYSREVLAGLIEERYDIKPILPQFRDSIEL